MGKQRIFKLNLNQTYDAINASVDVNKLKLSKKDTIDFTPAAIFTENKPRSAFLRSPRKLALCVDGQSKALEFSKATTELQTFWTKKEAEAHVNKTIAEAHTKFQPIKTWQFVVILGLLILIVVFLWRIGSGLGVLF